MNKIFCNVCKNCFALQSDILIKFDKISEDFIDCVCVYYCEARIKSDGSLLLHLFCVRAVHKGCITFIFLLRLYFFVQ